MRKGYVMTYLKYRIIETYAGFIITNENGKTMTQTKDTLDEAKTWIEEITQRDVKEKERYLTEKNKLRDEAKRIQARISNEHLAWWDIYDYQQELEKKARKYGLLKEFKENGIL